MTTIYKLNSRGEGVKQIQRALHLIPDGIFGKLTREALITWQRENRLTPDGIAGPETLAKLLPQVDVAKTTARRIEYIAVHCTATPEGKDKTVAQIRNEHMTQNGWSDIGYHFVIYRDGTIARGRSVDKVGAHVSGYNSHSIGVAYVGGLENNQNIPYSKLKAKDTRTPEQKQSLMRLLKELKGQYPRAIIKGHRDFSPDKNGDGIISPCEWIKCCPSFDALKEYSEL